VARRSTAPTPTALTRPLGLTEITDGTEDVH
jgi:hypothetical protein